MTRFLIVALALLATTNLFAHPEDDFCEPGDDSSVCGRPFIGTAAGDARKVLI